MKIVTVFRVVAVGLPDGYGVSDVPVAEFPTYEKAESYLEDNVKKLAEKFARKTVYRIDKVRAIR